MYKNINTMRAAIKALLTSTAVCGGVVATMTTGALASEECLVGGDSDLTLKLFEYGKPSNETTLKSTNEGDYIYLVDAFGFDDSGNAPFEASFRVDFSGLGEYCDPRLVGFLDQEGNDVYPAKVSFKVWNEYGTNISATYNYNDMVDVFPALSYGAAALDGVEILKAGRHSFAIEFKDENGKRLAGQKRNVIILPTSFVDKEKFAAFCKRPHLYLTNSGSGYSATKLGKKNTVYLNNGIVRLQEGLGIKAVDQGWTTESDTPSETLMNVSYDPEYTRFCSEYLELTSNELEEVKINIWNRGVQYPTGSDSTSSDGYFYAGDATTADEGFQFDQLRLEKKGAADTLYSFQAKLKFSDGSEESGKFNTQITTGLDTDICFDPATAGDCGASQ